MKKVIANKLYDTDSAKLIGSWSEGTDNTFMEESIFRKKTGEYFLYGNGGSDTKYGVHVGKLLGPGEEIIPLSDEKARKLAKDHLWEVYHKVFGVADGKSKALTIYLESSMCELLKQKAEKLGISKSEYVSKLLEKELKMEEK